MGAKGFYFDAFQVDEPAGTRWNVAMQLLREGSTIVYQGVGLSLAELDVVVVEVPAWVEVANMPESIASRDLANAEDLLAGLRRDSDFAKLTSGVGLRFG